MPEFLFDYISNALSHLYEITKKNLRLAQHDEVQACLLG